MLQNAYLVAKIGAGTAENEQHSADILPIARRVAEGRQRRLLREGVRVGDDLRVPVAGALRAAATILGAVGRRSARRQGSAKLQCKFETPRNLPKFRMTNRTSIQLD